MIAKTKTDIEKVMTFLLTKETGPDKCTWHKGKLQSISFSDNKYIVAGGFLKEDVADGYSVIHLNIYPENNKGAMRYRSFNYFQKDFEKFNKNKKS